MPLDTGGLETQDWTRIQHAILGSQSASGWSVQRHETEPQSQEDENIHVEIVEEVSESVLEQGRRESGVETIIETGDGSHDAKPQPTVDADSISQYKKRSRRKNTMNGMDPGDTQEDPSQVWTRYQESILSKDHSRGPNDPTPARSTVTDHAGAHTYGTGQEGYIDLMGIEDALDDPQPTQDRYGESEDELAAEDTQTREGLITSPAHMSPTTPALAGSKRDHRGKVLASAKRTPAPDFSTMFKVDQSRPSMGLSQIFHQTQALSSPPLIGQMRSDPVFERPSPDFRAGHQSSPGPESSPVATRKRPFNRSITDPRDIYVSMRDSQEQRRQMQDDIQRQIDELDEQDELSQDTEERKAELERQKDAIAKQTSKLFANMVVPSSMKVNRRKKIIEPNLKTPALRKGAAGQAILISDDTPRPVFDGAEDNVSDDGSVASSRVAYDEYGQELVAVPSSSRKTRKERRQDQRPGSSPARTQQSANRNVRDVRQTRTFDGGFSAYSARSSNAENYVPSQTMQVPYSQTNASDSLPPRPPRPVLVSSLDSRTFVSQSQQDFSLTSNARAEIDNMQIEVSSSIRPAPPVPFDDVDGDQSGVPTSPPSSPPGVATPTTDTLQQMIGSKSDPLLHHVSPKKMPPVTRRGGMRRVPDTSPLSTAAAMVPEVLHAQLGTEPPSASMPQTTNSTNERPSIQRSNSTGAFATAPSHPSVPLVPASGTPRRVQQPSASPSPRKRAGIGRMRFIDLDPTPPDRNAEIDAEIDVLNEEDHEFDALMMDDRAQRQRSNKRPRRTYSTRKALHEPSKEENKLGPSSLPDTQMPLPTATAPDSTDILQIDENHTSLELAAEDHKSTGPTESSSKMFAAESTVIPVVSASLQRNLIGPGSQWQKRRLRGQSNVGEDPLQASAVQHEISQPLGDRRDAPRLELDTANVQSASAALPFPQRVFARFKDEKRAYWPGTVIGTAGKLCSVQFDDGNVDEAVPVHLVKPLVLRPGFQVRVDDTKHKGKACVVKDVKETTATTPRSDAMAAQGDVFGHKTITVEVKQKSGNIKAKVLVTHTFDVATSKVYIMPNVWTQVPEQALEQTGAVRDLYGDLSMRLHTPTVSLSGPGTPTSRHRRSTLSAVQTETRQSFKIETKAGLFSNMAFAITLSDQQPESEKTALTGMIRSHGGTVLSDNFDALFQQVTSASTSGTATPVSSDPRSTELELVSSSAGLGFVALVTDMYSRKEKFLQALALDIPCLSTRWIRHSINKSECWPWPQYLLPAGESVTLDGAVRSRTLFQAPSDATMAVFQHTINQRQKLLQGKHVVLVTGKLKDEERKKVFVFLLRALGVASIERAKDVTAVKTLLSASGTKYDYIYANDGEIDLTASELACKKRSTPAKRKRKSEGAAVALKGAKKLSIPVDVAQHRLRVIDKEFVVQTLILGAVIEED